MHRSKLLESLKSLEREEYRWFRDFLASPYFNKHEGVQQLGDYLLDVALTGFPAAKLERKYIHKQLFPNAAYQEVEFNHLMSKLLKCLERFMIQRAFEADKSVQLCYALEASRKRKLEKNFAAFYRKANQKQGFSQVRDYLHRYQTTKSAQQNFADQEKRAEDPFLQATADYLDYFYLTERLKLNCSMLARQETTGEQFNISTLVIPSHTFADGVEAATILPRLYQSSYELLKTSADEQRLRAFLIALQTYSAQLAKQEVRELFNHAAFYCTQQIRKGYVQFVQLLFDLYQLGIQEGYLLIEGQLSPWIYKNVVKLGLGLQQYEWVETFIESHYEKLPATHQEDALYFNKADLHFHLKDYDQALLLLTKIEFSDVYYKLGAKEIQLKIFFEQQETEAFLSLCNAYRILIRREKQIGESAKLPYANLVKLAREIYQYKHAVNRQEEDTKLLKKVQETPYLTSRKWLLQQLKN